MIHHTHVQCMVCTCHLCVNKGSAVPSQMTQIGNELALGVFTWTRITFRKTFQNVIRPFPDLKA